MKELKDLAPKNIWNHFANICKIPHPSGHEEGLRQYLISFARNQNLEYLTDKIGNIVIKKSGQGAAANNPTYVLQSHIDMVPQKNSETQHDFKKDPILAYVADEWVKARGTTLGADNGIGVATALSILEDKNISHGPLECLFTIDEEAGMTGVANLDAKMLTGQTLINLDSEEWGEICIGCAGGMDGFFSKKIEWDSKPKPSDWNSYTLKIQGLRGGHSGVDIHLGRGNSNKLMVRLLLELKSKIQIKLSQWNGGNLRNAIPREASSVICIPTKDESLFLSYLKDFERKIIMELGTAETALNQESKIKVHAENGPEIKQLMSDDFFNVLTNLIAFCPHGITRLSPDVPGLVETSNNLAIVKTTENEINISCFFRSSVDSAMDEMMLNLQTLFQFFSFATSFQNRYSGWQPRLDTKIFKIADRTYRKITQKEPLVRAIHAGLECGYFTQIYPNMEMISIGPTICFPHSPDEKVLISSVEKFWDYLLQILETKV